MPFPKFGGDGVWSFFCDCGETGMDAKTAVLVDGEFYLKRFRKVDQKGNSASPEEVARALSWAALAHLRKQGRKRNQLYRIFFYDCPPMDRVLHNPLSQRGYNYRKTDRAQFRLAIHEALRKQRKVALRLGRMAPHGSWHLKEDRLKLLLRGKIEIDSLTENDLYYDCRQKEVDMKIGLDIASLTYKGLVDQLILISGDSDFVPAAKLARREGIDFILDPMWNSINPSLHEHIDGLYSPWPKPG